MVRRERAVFVTIMSRLLVVERTSLLHKLRGLYGIQAERDVATPCFGGDRFSRDCSTFR